MDGTIVASMAMWAAWLSIAAEHAADANRSQKAGYRVGRVCEDSMVAVTASAHAIDGFYGSVKPLVGAP